MEGGDFNQTSMETCELESIHGVNLVDCPDALPLQWECIGNHLVGPKANLDGALLSGLDLEGVELHTTTLMNTEAVGLVSCPESLPSQWHCVGDDLVGPTASLQGADLSGANLSTFNLEGVDFSQANLTGVNWTDATCPDGTSASAAGGSCCSHLNGAIPAAGCP